MSWGGGGVRAGNVYKGECAGRKCVIKKQNIQEERSVTCRFGQ